MIRVSRGQRKEENQIACTMGLGSGGVLQMHSMEKGLARLDRKSPQAAVLGSRHLGVVCIMSVRSQRPGERVVCM